jgi:hypothetical protein
MERVRAAAGREQAEEWERPEAEAEWGEVNRGRVPGASAYVLRAGLLHPIRRDFPATRWSVRDAVKRW